MKSETTSTALPPAPAPRYALAWACLTFVLCTLTLGYPALTGGFLVTPISDQYIGGFPVREFAASAIKAGEGIPQWNPYIFGGLPYIAAMHGDIFYPTALLRALLPTDVAMTLSFMIHLFLAGLFTYLFARAVGLSFFAGIVAGVAYMMSGPIASYASPGHDGKLYVSALLPLTLLFLVRGVRDGRVWAWGGLAITIGLAVLSPHPQLLQYLLLCSGSFALYLALGTWNGVRLERRVAMQRLGIALGAVLLGALIGAIQYGPVREYVNWSPRAGGTDYRFATSYSFPVEELVNMYLPQFTGMLERYWGRNGIHFHSEYIGPAVLILATAAVGAKGVAPALSRSFKRFWLGVLVVSLLWALGNSTPFYHLVYAIVPGTKFFRAPSTMIFVTTFAISLFAGMGAERVLAAQWERHRLIFAWLGAAVVVALLALIGGLTNLGIAIVGTGATVNGTPLSELVAANSSAVMVGALRSLLFTLLTVAVIWAIAQRKLGGRQAAIALVLVIVADLWSVERNYWRFSKRASEVYRSDATIDYLKARHDSSRVLAITLGSEVAYHDPMLNGDGLMVHRVRQVLGYHGNEIGRYDLLTGKKQGLEPLFLPQVWSLLNMRYLLTNVDPSHPAMQQLFAGQASLVAGPARNAAGTMVYLYQLSGENPAAWVAAAAVKAPDDAVLATLHDPRFNSTMQRRAALVDTASTLRGVPDPSAIPQASPISATVRRPTSGRILVDLSAPAQDGNVLIVSENFYPGWQARVDGRPATTERVDYSLVGVALPAGGRQVELFFNNRTYAVGKLITIVAAVAAILLLLAGWFLDRTRARATVAA